MLFKSEVYFLKCVITVIYTVTSKAFKLICLLSAAKLTLVFPDRLFPFPRFGSGKMFDGVQGLVAHPGQEAGGRLQAYRLHLVQRPTG